MSIIAWLKDLLGLGRRPQGVSPFAAGTGPARLLIMRHAEKTGDKRDRSLSQAGWARAEKLVTYIPQTFAKPDFLIAAASGKKSDRPYDTLAPLAKALGLPIIDDLDDEEVDALVEMLKEPEFKGKFGVISWRHSDLPRLIGALGAPSGSFPSDWDDTLYDVVYELAFTGEATPGVRRIQEPF